MDTISLIKIDQLVEEYGRLLKAELDETSELAFCEWRLERDRQTALLAAYADGRIDGKNADLRSLQEGQVVADDQAYGISQVYVQQSRDRAGLATVERKAAEARISLTRAWLYSQAPER